MDRYLLSTDAFIQYFKKSHQAFFDTLVPSQCFISVISLGMIESRLEQLDPARKTQISIYYRSGLNAMKGRILDFEQNCAKDWARMRELSVYPTADKSQAVAEDIKMMLATASSHQCVWVGESYELAPPNDFQLDFGLYFKPVT